ncbi:RNA-directed DNA polymerase from mobile element jockey [Plakobranchus ocellatus]|uniref:RNA-directed DNA polymerase from mobile element jockey n=1 Tax=Plakobranchus ocellatus TaxID=259542 RepID=A0AAV3Z0C7_9GAST|nr:RNA-directed DNA polymerase from mobile element jockey [Plakobranchus ocellatus]
MLCSECHPSRSERQREPVKRGWNDCFPKRSGQKLDAGKTKRLMEWYWSRVCPSPLQSHSAKHLYHTPRSFHYELKNNPLLTQDITTFLNRIYSYPSTSIRQIDLGDYQMLDANVQPILENLFWEKNINVRSGPVFAYSKKADTVENFANRFRKDAISAVSRISHAERTLLAKHFAKVDMDEAMETGSDIMNTSFLGKFNESSVTYRDLANRVAREGGFPRDVILGVLQKEEVSENINKMVGRFSLESLKINGENLNNLRFADDAVLIAETGEQLQKLLDTGTVVSERERVDLSLNVKKTECMVISKKSSNPKCNLVSKGKQIKQVTKFKYQVT